MFRLYQFKLTIGIALQLYFSRISWMQIIDKKRLVDQNFGYRLMFCVLVSVVLYLITFELTFQLAHISGKYIVDSFGFGSPLTWSWLFNKPLRLRNWHVPDDCRPCRSCLQCLYHTTRCTAEFSNALVETLAYVRKLMITQRSDNERFLYPD